MSVTSLLRLPRVREHLDRVIPDFPKYISAPLLVPPATRNYSLVGTAFDYALRFELQRRYPYVRTQAWIAECAVNSLESTRQSFRTERDIERLFLEGKLPAGMVFIGSAGRNIKERDRKVARTILERAKREVGLYLQDPAPSDQAKASMVAHAIRLARLDAYYRQLFLDPEMEVADPSDVKDILRLLDLVPHENLADPKILWLNPTFGRYSSLVGGADCDLVSGDRLIDVKVTQHGVIKQDHIRQLVSYLILARAARRDDSTWPSIRRIGIYFARHGFLWTMPAEDILSNRSYTEVEKWYLKGAWRSPLSTKKTRSRATGRSRSPTKKTGRSGSTTPH